MKFTHCFQVVFVVGKYIDIFLRMDFIRGKFPIGLKVFGSGDFPGDSLHGGICQNSDANFVFPLTFLLATPFLCGDALGEIFSGIGILWGILTLGGFPWEKPPWGSYYQEKFCRRKFSAR